MARLRIRVELSRGGAGVPLHKLASVIAESQKFLSLLTEDVQIDQQRGEWLGFDFDRESLNFTAEYAGPVTAQQMEAFNAAFDGTTPLRRDTIGQFLRITEAIGEDEVIGFGLYQADATAEPTEWRCLSRRDAWRIAEEVQILMGAGKAPHLPAVSDPSLGARMFGDRRDRNLRENRLAEYVREVESGLSTRMQRVETQVQKHSGMIGDLQVQSAATDTSFRNLLSTFETFCNQATRNIERMAPSALPAAPAGAPASPVVLGTEQAGLSHSTPWVHAKPWAHAKPRAVSMAGVGAAIVIAGILGVWLWPANSGTPGVTPPATVSAASVEVPAPRPVPPETGAASPVRPVSPGAGMEIALDATEPSWVSIKDQSGKILLAELLAPGTSKTIKLQGRGTLRAGNAGSLAVRLNGNPIGKIGPSGGVRDIEFKDGKFTIATP